MDNDVEKLVKKTQKIIKSIDDYFIYVSNILSNVKYLPYKDERLVLKNTFSNLQNNLICILGKLLVVILMTIIC